MKSLGKVFEEARNNVMILCANGSTTEKMKLGISNQSYPEEKDRAAVRLAQCAIRAELAERILFDTRFLFHSAAAYWYKAEIEKMLSEIRIAD